MVSQVSYLKKCNAVLYVLIVFLSVFFSHWSTFAQIPSKTITWAIEYDPTSTNLWLYARFCDVEVATQWEKKSLKIAVSPWKTTKLCVDVLNQLDQEASVHIGFVDATKDANWIIWCAAEDTMWNFWQYISWYVTVDKVPAYSFKRIQPEIKMPASAAGTVYGCITVYNDTVYRWVQWKSSMPTLIRNWLPMEVFVDTKVDVGLELAPVVWGMGTNLASDPVFVAKQANWTYQVAVGFKNIGGLDENVEVAGSVTDTLKKVTELAPQTVTVAPEANGDIRYEIPALPWYKMWFTVDLTVTHNAVSEFRTEFITDQLLAKKTLTVSKTFFVFPWWIVAVLVVLALIIHLINRSRKHHHDEEKELEELKKWKAEHATPAQ
jgi:hypothetical protein